MSCARHRAVVPQAVRRPYHAAGARSGSRQDKTGRRWCYALDDRRGRSRASDRCLRRHRGPQRRPSCRTPRRVRGTLQVDGYDGFKRLASGRADSSVKRRSAGGTRGAVRRIWASTKSPLAAAVLAKISELYAIEAEIRRHPAEHRQRIRQERSRPVVDALHAWLQDHLGRVSGARIRQRPSRRYSALARLGRVP